MTDLDRVSVSAGALTTRTLNCSKQTVVGAFNSIIAQQLVFLY
jgi:hypothetical protein